MKLRSAPLDDVHQEMQFALRQDGSPLACTLLRLFAICYRAHHALLLTVLRHRWGCEPAGSSTIDYPTLGEEPFNASPDDIEKAWERRGA